MGQTNAYPSNVSSTRPSPTEHHATHPECRLKKCPPMWIVYLTERLPTKHLFKRTPINGKPAQRNTNPSKVSSTKRRPTESPFNYAPTSDITVPPNADLRNFGSNKERPGGMSVPPNGYHRFKECRFNQTLTKIHDAVSAGDRLPNSML